MQEPSPTAWLREAEICSHRPAVTPRLLDTWREKGLITYSRTTDAVNSPALYRLVDVDVLMNSLVTPARCGPLAVPAEAAPTLTATK